jgi:predicted Rossmann fold flavoprotein
MHILLLLKCEKDNRVFPLSDRGESIVECFEKLFADHRVTILRQHTVQKIEKNDEKFIVYSKNSPAMVVDKVIITLGGQAYRHTGSTGDGYSLAEALGHTITPLAPSLHSFITKEKWLKKLAGVAFPILGLSAGVKKRQSIVGPALCTHSGITGPAVFALSSLTAFEAFDTNNPLSITIDFVPEFSYEALLKKITDLIEAHPKKDFKNTLHHFVPHSVAETLCEIGGLDGDRNNAEISNAQKEKAADVLKKTIIEAIGRGAGDEFVTAGGIALSEVDPKTMESKICPGLFFAGEILDIDGFTGGFNLQAAWATGHVAGKNACNKEKGSLN